MAYREVAMWEILEVLRRIHGGDNHSAITRTTGRSRSTIRRYLAAASDLGWAPGRCEPTEALAAEIERRLSPARGRPAGEAEQLLMPHQEQIRTWLKPAPAEKRGLRLTKVHQLLERRGAYRCPTARFTALPRSAVAWRSVTDRPYGGERSGGGGRDRFRSAITHEVIDQPLVGFTRAEEVNP
jgi:hypothetical protein